MRSGTGTRAAPTIERFGAADDPGTTLANKHVPYELLGSLLRKGELEWDHPHLIGPVIE